MAGMGSVITVSPRIPVAELEIRARARLDRAGVAVCAAAVADGRQVAHLRRLGACLVADPALEVIGPSDHLDGAAYLIVYRAGGPRPGYWGGARGAAEGDPADVDVQIIDWDA